MNAIAQNSVRRLKNWRLEALPGLFDLILASRRLLELELILQLVVGLAEASSGRGDSESGKISAII